MIRLPCRCLQSKLCKVCKASVLRQDAYVVTEAAGLSQFDFGSEAPANAVVLIDSFEFADGGFDDAVVAVGATVDELHCNFVRAEAVECNVGVDGDDFAALRCCRNVLGFDVLDRDA